MVVDISNNVKAIKQGNLLVVDDDPNVVSILLEMLDGTSYNLISAYSVAEAQSIIRRQNISIVLTDLLLGDGTGVEILKEARRFHPDSQIILMTGRPTIQNAVDVIKEGAYDYLVKPFGMERVRMTLDRAAEKIRLEQENIRLKELMSFYQISEAMGSIMELDPLLDLILTTSIKEFEADCAAIFLTGNNTSQLELRSSVGFEDNDFGKIVMEHCQEISTKIADTGASQIFDDPEIEFEWGERTIKSSMCQLLLVKGKLLGNHRNCPL